MSKAITRIQCNSVNSNINITIYNSDNIYYDKNFKLYEYSNNSLIHPQILPKRKVSKTGKKEEVG